MVKYRIQARNVSNVAASKTALIDLPCGQRYHYVVLEHAFASGTNTIAGAQANVLEIRIKVNGRLQRTISGTQLRDMNIVNGTTYDCQGVPNTAPGVSFPIFFAEPWRKSPGDQDALAWRSNGWSTFQIEVDLGAASTPTLAAHCVVDDANPTGDVSIVKWLRQSFAAAGTSFDISTLDRRDFLQQISIYADSGASVAISKATLRKDGRILHEMTNSANFALLTNHGMVPTASGRTPKIYDLVLDHDDLLGSAVLLNGSRDVTLTIEAASAMSGTSVLILQKLGPLE